jgi:RNA polymerase sigma-B factor
LFKEAEFTVTGTAGHGSDFAALDSVAQEYAHETGASRAVVRDQLAGHAAPIARRLARRYRGRGEALEDLEQVAVLGALKAIDGYDVDRGPFSPYLLATVSGELKKHFRDRGWTIRVPRRTQELVAAVTQASAKLTAQRSTRPSIAELAAELAVSEAEVGEALASASAYRPTSLNATLPGDDGAELGDTLGGIDGALGQVDDRLTIAELLCRLPARERQMLAMRFYGNCTQTEIAEALGMSQMHASRLLSQALTWLRDALLSDDPVHWKAGSSAPDTTRLAVETSVEDGAIVVAIGGELDRDSAAQLRRALAAATRMGAGSAATRVLRVDLRGVSFIDAAAIATLIGAREAAGRSGMRLRLVGARQHVARSLATAGLWPYLDPGPD